MIVPDDYITVDPKVWSAIHAIVVNFFDAQDVTGVTITAEDVDATRNFAIKAETVEHAGSQAIKVSLVVQSDRSATG